MIHVGNTARGLIAAFFGVIGYGAFGAPLKGEGTSELVKTNEPERMNKMFTNKPFASMPITMLMFIKIS